ncbi:MAG: hypothetical protein ACM3X9_11880 [Bacillota bacterium]
MANPAICVNSPTFREIVDNPEAYKGRILMITGEISAVVESNEYGLYLTDLNKTNSAPKRSAVEVNIYLVNDGTENIMIVTTKHFILKQQVTLESKLLVSAKDSPDEEAVMLFDRNITKKQGFSSPGYSRITLRGLLNKLPKDKFWVLLIDVK